ncbi:MAG: anacyclamide/piricyclamide family prenylated cyclic peptide [Dolichospermum sp. LBC05a]|nr:anacyclamide/piricyclamide family prenylated cyclic peptide [Dolichospermum sp. OL01]MCO5798759.1 anacyclamide/piricyclamide family prenylated cyclic peptide [Dolichospermum sp. OL03]MCS6280631.1 anacyclamide/piricyclamide family prenylated cyclic peptide [Dolichospermum sp.]QSV60172.1 MAG: anacyclamide/piricyclamide family prenylated cyclic peptide [Dolichospermum sp. LBC05a]
MTKKNIRPQQVAPVERETISTAKDQSGQVEESGRRRHNSTAGGSWGGDWE